MAKVKIQGSASGTGIFTVTAPDSDTNRTITLPDGTGTLAFTTGDDDKLPLAGGTLTGDLDISDTGVGALTVGGTTNAYSAPVLFTVTDLGLDITDGTKHLASWATHGGSSHAGSAIGTRSNHDLALITNDTKRVFIDTSGFVGFGESNPMKSLHVSRADSDCMLILESAGTASDKQVCFAEDYGSGNETGGNYWGIGVDSSENELNICFDADTQASMGGPDTVMSIESDGSAEHWVDASVPRLLGATGSNDGGEVYIGVTNTYATSGSTDEFSRIRCSMGNAGIAFGGYKGDDTMTGGARDAGFQIVCQAANAESLRFQIDENGTITASDTSIGSLSDERLKKDIADYTYNLDTFKSLRPRTFKWKNDWEHTGDETRRGFIAQEIEPVDDYWVSTDKIRPPTDQILDKETYYTKDDELPEGKNIGDVKTPTTYGYQYEKGDGCDYDLLDDGSDLANIQMIAKLGKKDAMYVSVIKQLITKIETLETKVTALEA